MASMKMNKFEKLTDNELTEETHRLARSVSYYNAAEGNWSRETADRNATNAEFWTARKEMERRGIEFENRGYLL